jgi:hypothetical protein
MQALQIARYQQFDRSSVKGTALGSRIGAV